MSAQPRTQAAIAESATARRLIDLLSRIHPLLLVYDAQGILRWMSDDFRSLYGGAAPRIGQPLYAILPRLPIEEQLAPLRSRFAERGFLPNVRLDLETERGVRRPLEVSVLRLPESDGEALLAVIARSGDAPAFAPFDGAESVLVCASGAIVVVS